MSEPRNTSHTLSSSFRREKRSRREQKLSVLRGREDRFNSRVLCVHGLSKHLQEIEKERKRKERERGAFSTQNKQAGDPDSLAPQRKPRLQHLTKTHTHTHRVRSRWSCSNHGQRKGNTPAV